jgi:hypothetical protein
VLLYDRKDPTEFAGLALRESFDIPPTTTMGFNEA